MQIIPVIDLKDHAVVHAKHGQREHYAPIRSSLCQGTDIHTVIRAYLSLYNFDTFYIADLNAIMGNLGHTELINRVLKNYPNLIFWIDSGRPIVSSDYHQHANYRPVIGSESFSDITYGDLDVLPNNFILSLDFAGKTRLGTKKLFTSSAFWPSNIIIMTLDRVGSNQGPDVAKLESFITPYTGYNFIAAGGIRNFTDVIHLKTLGINAVLLASALHSGGINATELKSLEAL